MRKVKFHNIKKGRIVDYNQFYEVKQLEKPELDEVFKTLFYIFPNIRNKQADYMTFMVTYLTYAVNRDELKDVDFMYTTKLEGVSAGECDPVFFERESLPLSLRFSTRTPLFKKFEGYVNFFEAIDMIEHEVSHLYDYENWPYDYVKFENENGRLKIPFNVSLMVELFSNTPYEKIAWLWERVVYYNSHSEIFARQRAQVHTTQFFEFLKQVFSDQKGWQEIEEGFKKYEESINYLNEKTTEWAYDLFSNKDIKDINEDGIRFSDLKREFDKVVQATATGDFSTIPYLDESKIELVNSNLHLVNTLALANTIYNQENIDKLFNMQVNFEKIDYKAISILIMHKSNKNSAKHLKTLREKAKEYGEEDLLQENLETFIPRKHKQETPMNLLEL